VGSFYNGAVGATGGTLGSGDELQYQIVDTTAQLLTVKDGTAASPDLSESPLIKVSRSIGAITAASVTGDGSDELAAIVGHAHGVSADCEVQPVGVMGIAKNIGDTNAGGGPLPDACGLYGVGWTLGSSVGTGIGAYLEGRSSSATGKAAGLEVRVRNTTGSAHSVDTTGFSTTQAIWVTASGPDRSACGIQFGNPFDGRFHTGIHFNGQTGTDASVGPTVTNDIRSDSTATNSIVIDGTHTFGLAIDAGAGKVSIGRLTELFSTALLEVLSTTSRTPLVVFGSDGAVASSINLRSSSGLCNWFVAAGANDFITGTVAGDTGLQAGTAAKSFHIGGTESTIEVTRANELGFFNDATPATKQTVTGSRGANAALASLLTALAAYGLITDSSS
jgi:hypothetical protein